MIIPQTYGVFVAFAIEDLRCNYPIKIFQEEELIGTIGNQLKGKSHKADNTPFNLIQIVCIIFSLSKLAFLIAMLLTAFAAKS